MTVEEPEHVHDENCESMMMALIPVPVDLVPVLIGGLQLAVELSEMSVLDGRATMEDIMEQVTDIKEVLAALLTPLGIDPAGLDLSPDDKP
jgi:hypothetical protein